MERTEQMVGTMDLSAWMYGLANTVHTWTPVLIFVLCCMIIALIGYLFDSYHDE